MSKYLRPAVRSMRGYTPGEQPRVDDILKLNTNENPYPPSPRVSEAVEEVLRSGALRKYPDPVGAQFRQTAGKVLNVDPDAILIGNGSDDILTILTRAFVPENGLIVSPTPSYLLYRTLAEIQGARFVTAPFTTDWRLPSPWPLTEANLTFVANPNSPSGTFVSLNDLAQLAEQISGPLVVDEAYVDFAEDNALPLLRDENVIITRTLSKSYALAGLRFGFGVAHPDVIRHLFKVKDSYNCDMLSLAAATAALEDQEYLRSTRDRIISVRQRLQDELSGLGFQVVPSQANFVWCQHPQEEAKKIYDQLHARKILVRFMAYDGYQPGLRITVGTSDEIDRLLESLRQIL